MARPGISTKNTKKLPPGPKFWKPDKTPRKYRKNTQNEHFWYFFYFFGIFGTFSEYFLGGPEVWAGGYFFGIFRGNSGSGHFGAL